MFKTQFAPMVASGAKRQTIRPVPKGRRPQEGDVESWREWSGLPYRSKQRELAKVQLTEVCKIRLRDDGFDGLRVITPGRVWPKFSVDELARADGFPSITAMRRWFVDQHGLPFDGILIKAVDVIVYSRPL